MFFCYYSIMNLAESNRAKELIALDLSKLDKRTINGLRAELITLINWFYVTPIIELRVLGVFGLLQDMINKRDEMLQILKNP